MTPHTTLLVGMIAMAAAAQGPTNIGNRLELLVDEYLVEQITGDLKLELHQPTRREVVLKTDAPWEGNASAYQSVFRDGDLYRMYYRGLHYRHSGEPAQVLEDHPWFLCMAESVDGVNWVKPELGLFEFNGSTANNIVMTPESLSEIGGDPAHTAVFLDTNPSCPEHERIKVVILGKPHGLYLLGSGDGVHFSLLSEEPVITEGAFDSQNLMFWDPVREEYREYHRGFKDGVRDIMTATSDDCLDFPEPQWLAYEGSEKEHLYTNQVQPYYRAPHIFMGFPMRYSDRGWSTPMLELPGRDERLIRAQSHPRYGTTVTDGLFMTSRDGLTFHRWAEGFIRPGPRQRGSWVYGDNFIFWGMLETVSSVEDAPNEISLYATEGYWEGTHTSARRYTLRVDGFVSASAPMAGGELVTKPLTFEGGNLTINAETSGAGSIRVEVQEADGTPIEGYELDECPPIFCDSLRHVVRWEHMGGDLRDLAGKPVRLRFEVKDADLYAFQFAAYEPEPEWPDVVNLGALPKQNRDRGPFVVIDDDFQAAEAGTSPAEEDLDPPATEGSGWLIGEGSPDRAQVLNDDPPGSGTPGERHYLKLERRNENHHQGGYAWVRLSPQDAADSKGATVEVRATILVPSTNAYVVDIDAYDNPPGEFVKRGFHVRFWPDGNVSYYREQENIIEGLAIPVDEWVDVLITADLAEQTFDLTVAGETVTGLPFGVDGVRRVQAIAFCPNRNDCTLYVDSARVEVRP